MKIKVMIDSSADISLADEKEKNFTVARFPLTIDNVEYFDEIDINMEQFKEHLYNGSSISTSQAPVGVLIEMWEELLLEYDAVIYLTISGGLSGSYQSATMASKEFEGRVTVIDGKLVAYPIQLVQEACYKYIDEGKSPLEIKEIIENRDNMFAFIIPYDINHLKKGGRITPQAAALANLLKIVPILAFEEGTIDAYDKVRTNKKAVKKALNLLVEKYPDAENYYWYIMQSDVDEMASDCKKEIEKLTGENVIVKDLFPIILTHTGPKTIALGVMRKFD